MLLVPLPSSPLELVAIRLRLVRPLGLLVVRVGPPPWLVLLLAVLALAPGLVLPGQEPLQQPLEPQYWLALVVVLLLVIPRQLGRFLAFVLPVEFLLLVQMAALLELRALAFLLRQQLVVVAILLVWLAVLQQRRVVLLPVLVLVLEPVPLAVLQL